MIPPIDPERLDFWHLALEPELVHYNRPVKHDVLASIPSLSTKSFLTLGFKPTSTNILFKRLIETYIIQTRDQTSAVDL